MVGRRRLHVDSCEWLDAGARERLRALYPNRITRDGYLFTVCEEYAPLIPPIRQTLRAEGTPEGR